jgi:hypothetical protein
LKCNVLELLQANTNETRVGKTPIQEADKSYHKAMVLVKSSVDKVSRVLTDVVLIEEDLKHRAWDTTAQREYLREETRKVSAKKDRDLDPHPWENCLYG